MGREDRDDGERLARSEETVIMDPPPTAQEVARAHEKWLAKYEGAVKPDPRYATDGPSQYPETVEETSATTAMDEDLWNMVEDEVLRRFA